MSTRLRPKMYDVTAYTETWLYKLGTIAQAPHVTAESNGLEVFIAKSSHSIMFDVASPSEIRGYASL